MPKFLLQYQGAVIREIPISKKEMTVGRTRNNDIVIDSPAVSGRHCRITFEANTLVVEDLNSTNGVFVNGQKITKSSVHTDDVIGIAKHALKLVADGFAAGNSAPSALRNAAVLRVIKGAVGEPEVEVSARSTYIGGSPHAHIRIKGTGIFSPPPESAAVISKEEDGYYLLPIKEGYSRLNGNVVVHRELLSDKDEMQVGGTLIRFELKPARSFMTARSS